MVKAPTQKRTTLPENHIHSTCKGNGWKITFLLGWHIFRCHVSFKDGNSPLPLKKSCLANKPFLLSCSLCSGAGWLIFGIFSPNPLGQKHALKQVKYSISGGSFIFPKVQGKKNHKHTVDGRNPAPAIFITMVTHGGERPLASNSSRSIFKNYRELL